MKYLFTISLFALLFLSCESEPAPEVAEPKKSTKANQVNPNGDSELALLMREMADELTNMKTDIEAGKKPGSLSDYKTIHSAIPTKASMKENGYESFAQSFLHSIEELEKSGQSNQTNAFNGVIDACMNCHEVTCHGPMRRIEKMYVKEDE